MSIPICCTDLEHPCCEARIASASLVAQLRLPRHERDDLRQDLLADLIARQSSFDPSRGTWGAFVGTVVAHRATRLAKRIQRERKVFAPVSLDDPRPGTEGGTVAEALAERDGYAAWLGHPTDAVAAVERRLDLDRALGNLGRSDRALCAALAWNTPEELSRAGHGARSTLYRRLAEIRLRLMAAGLRSEGLIPTARIGDSLVNPRGLLR